MQTKLTHTVTLLETLKTLFPDSSMNTLRSWIEKGRVSIAGKVVTLPKHPVQEGERVKVGPKVQFIRGNVKILFEDEHLVVIDKPEGLLSVATDFQNQHTAHNILKRRFHSQKVFPVHRLDRETSGVMVYAYNERSRTSFKEQFEKRGVEKIYYAVVEGKVAEQKGTWKSYLKEDARFVVSSTPFENEGKLAVTHFEVVAQNRRMSLLKLHLETGRKNQIRVHCKDAGHPVVGDKKYGASLNPLKRLCLHSQKITFRHPLTNKEMSFETPIPQEFSSQVDHQ